MALESVSVADDVIQSIDDNDLEDGEIPSDEDDESVPVTQPEKKSAQPPKPISVEKVESPKYKTFENKISKDKKAETTGKSTKQKNSDDWAGDVEKAIKAALDEDKSKEHESKSRSKRSGSSSSNSNKKPRKRHRDEKDQKSKDQKKKRLSEEDNPNEDDDEMLFVRGASPLRRNSFDNSPHRRSDHDSYNSGSDYDDRPISNRHRDEKRSGGRWTQSRQLSPDRGKKAPLSAARRGIKNERNAKGKGVRTQLRNDRNDRRRNDHHMQDPDAICVYYMQGKCHRGDDCPYSHDALPPRKMELCKFYLMDCCAKRDKCLYMHHDFPCKFFHTGSKCAAGENCKFSHEPMSEQVRNILLKHLETAPKEILGNFPRLSREGALYLITTTEKKLAHGHDSSHQKIPSLFDLQVPTPNDNMSMDHRRDDIDDYNRDRMYKDKKSSGGKRTRWGADEDRVPIDVIVKSASHHLGMIANNQEKPAANFYGEAGPNDIIKEIREEPKKDSLSITLSGISKDVDLRQLLLAAKSSSQTLSLAEQAANYAKSKNDEGRDRNEESGIVIDMQSEEDRNKIKALEIKISQQNSELDRLRNSPNVDSQDAPSTLPKRTQELYMRIQQQQREATDSHKNLENTENQTVQEDWYSDDDNEDDDDENQLTIVDSQKDEEEEQDKSKEEPPLQPAAIPETLIPQPAPIVDKLGDLSKIDISMEVSKLLSSIKAQSSSSKTKQESGAVPKETSGDNADAKSNVPEAASQFSKTETSDNSPGMSPTSTSATAAPASVSRDPRMSRDPRQRRDENRQSIGSASVSTKPTESKANTRPLRLETSIYSSGIIAQDIDTDLRSDRDQDHRRKDMDLRCFAPTSNFGDTDLRFGGAPYSADNSKSGDVDLRHMLSLPFKPVPSHVPCTEIEAGINSHPPMPYKVYTVDVPRPDYTGLKLTRNDPRVKYDPRIRLILRLSNDDLADSPMSPPPVKMLDTPKSPPLVRADPRRKALEVSSQPPKIIPTTVQQHPIHDHSGLSGMGMGASVNYSQSPVGMQQVPMMHQQGMGVQGMMMQTNPVMNTPLLRDPVIGQAPVLSNSAGAGVPMHSSSMRMANMGPQGPSHSSQMNQYDPRYNSGRGGGGVGLLGVAPQNMAPYNPDVRAYDGPSSRYQNDSYSGYESQRMDRMDRMDRMERDLPPRGFNNGQMDDSSYMGSPSDWNGSQGRMRDRKDRRRPTRGKFGGMSRKKDL